MCIFTGGDGRKKEFTYDLQDRRHGLHCKECGDVRVSEDRDWCPCNYYARRRRHLDRHATEMAPTRVVRCNFSERWDYPNHRDLEQAVVTRGTCYEPLEIALKEGFKRKLAY